MSEEREGKQTTVARQVVAALQEIGIEYVFGVPSGGWVNYMEELRKAEGIEFILATHEGGAAMMADVYGRLTGRPGVCFGTFGPGATNLTTGVGGALLDRSPMIALSDEMPAELRGRVTQMGVDHQAIFAPLTKATTRLEADTAKAQIFAAARLATAEPPGPVHIGLPVNLSALPAAEENVRFTPPAPIAAPTDIALQALLEQWRRAHRPVIAVGLGAVRAGIGPWLADFARRWSVPVVLTPMAKGLLAEDHPCYAGVLFHALSDLVGQTHAQADLVLAIGYDPVEFNYEAWMPSVPLASIDIVPADIDRREYPQVTDVVGEINAACARLAQESAGAKQWDMAALERRRNELFARLSQPQAAFGPVRALEVLREVLPADGIMACDVGAHTHLIGQKWPTPAPGLQIMTNGWSTMGFGIPAAIAAKLARPQQAVCAVVGDGGFLMTCGELATAVRYNTPIVVVLFTDNDLALIRIKQQKKGYDIYGTPVRARGTVGGDNLFGVPVKTAADDVEFKRALEEAFACGGPVIVEALLDSREYDQLVLKKDKVV